MSKGHQALNETVSSNVRRLRNESGLSLKKVAELVRQDSEVRLTQSYFSELEKGRRSWTTAQIAAVAAALEVPPFRLMMPGPGADDALELLRRWYEDGTGGVLNWLSSRV